jgi:hypothetical protein
MSVSTVSRVVPGSAATVTRSAPTRRFSSEDFPDVGPSHDRDPDLLALVRGDLGRLRGEPCRDLLHEVRDPEPVLGRERDRLAEPQLEGLRRMIFEPRVVHLVPRHEDSRCDRRSRDASSRSPCRDPRAPVEDEHDDARFVDRDERLPLDLSCIAEAPDSPRRGPDPRARCRRTRPVSQSRQALPFRPPPAVDPSRVVPGTSVTSARRSPRRRLKRVDLPAFGTPRRATTGRRTAVLEEGFDMAGMEVRTRSLARRGGSPRSTGTRPRLGDSRP